MIAILWTVLTLLGVLGVLANAASMADGFRLRRGVRTAMRLSFGAYLPRVALLLPVRDLDPGFDENARALLSQAYPAYRVLLVADTPEDPAVPRFLEVSRAAPHVPVAVLRSDPQGPPGKVNALRTALAHLSREDEVIVFADADIRPAKDWLRQLVQPLADITVGVSTGFRWYVPPRPTFWSLVRSEWNGVSANILFDPRRAFVWGGSCALRAEHLPKFRLEARWRGVLSDDLVLAQAVREARLRIAYAPGALVATHEGADRRTCMEWCLRQMTMATLYLPVVRRYAVGAFALFNGTVVLGALSAGLGLVAPAFLVPAALLLITLPATVAKASLRRRALFSASPSVAASWRVPAWKSAGAALAVPWVMALGLWKTRKPSVVRWRGRTFDVRNPYAIRLISPETDSAGFPGTSRSR